MKAFYILAPLALATLGGCSYYNTPPVAVAPVTTTPNTVVLGAPGTTSTAPSTIIVQPNR